MWSPSKKTLYERKLVYSGRVFSGKYGQQTNILNPSCVKNNFCSNNIFMFHNNNNHHNKNKANNNNNRNYNAS